MLFRSENCWAWSINYHPKRPLSAAERQAMEDGKGIHVKYVPGTFLPLANKGNDYLMDRATQKLGTNYSGIEGIAMQDASLQESMGPIQDRTREHLGPTDVGIVEFRKMVMAAARALQSGTPPKSAQAAKKYAVRAGGWMSRAETDFADVMTERFGHRHGYVGTEYGFGE